MFSKEHIEFIKKKKRRKRFILIIQSLILFSFIIVWQLLADFNLINSFLFSSPKSIYDTLIKLSKTNLFDHIFITFYETIISFLICVIYVIIFKFWV